MLIQSITFHFIVLLEFQMILVKNNDDYFADKYKIKSNLKITFQNCDGITTEYLNLIFLDKFNKYSSDGYFMY